MKGRTRLPMISVHPATEKYLRRIKNERAVPLGQAVDILYLDLLANRQRVKELETRLVEATRFAANDR